MRFSKNILIYRAQYFYLITKPDKRVKKTMVVIDEPVDTFFSSDTTSAFEWTLFRRCHGVKVFDKKAYLTKNTSYWHLQFILTK
jgi:hypothetical protein